MVTTSSDARVSGDFAATATQPFGAPLASRAGEPALPPLRADSGFDASRPRWRRNLVFACFQATYWVGMGVMFYQYIGTLMPAGERVGEVVVGRMLVGAVATTVVHLVYVRWFRGLERSLRWPLLAVSTALALASSRTLASGLYSGMPVARLIVAALWLAIYVGLEIAQDEFESILRASRAEARAAEAEAAATASELRRLEAQMNPHFLFNALNAVAANSRDPEVVVQVTQDLADFLRASLRKTRPLEPLAAEISQLEKYLSVQQARFGDDLACEVECDRDAPSVLVPPMMLQPLLENAFEYGGRTSPRPLVVKVRCRVEGDRLVASVSNTGAWVPPGHGRSSGLGLATLRRRLDLLLGRETSIDVETDDGRVNVVVRMPVTSRQSASVAEG